ncbi:hypothetical protein CVS40_10560 [Lucilia cuprina]|nr:hypothetical protein CVS40_10560 [Lucilia cuprina]
MITYYSKFIPYVSTLTFPLRQLLEKNKKFVWTKECQEAFTNLKQEILKDRVLVPFNQSLPVVLVCDASPTGIAAVLSHIMDGEERPVAFISRALTKAERNYSQLDREALAIIFAIHKFFMYLYGREFTLITDIRPLFRIFHHNNKSPAMTSGRLLRYASFLQGFNYKIEHRKADDIVNVDCLSRAPIKEKPNSEHFIDEEVRIIQEQIVNQISTYSVTAITIANETDHDEELAKLKKDLVNGDNADPDYSIQNGIIFKANRVVIPAKLRTEILNELHHTHIGIVKMKQLARKYCYWKAIDSDIEQIVRSCSSCAKIRNSPPRVPVHSWEEPDENFQRVHIDYAGPFQNHYFLVLVDAKSKWPEIRLQRDAQNSEKTITLLQDIFFTHGLPQVMVSDNATIFQSDTFKSYCINNGIIQKFIAPGHPATNGLAERYVQILKRKLKAMEEDNSPLNIKVQEILLRYRANPLANGKTPSQLYLGRDLKIKLEAIRPIKHQKATVSLPVVRQFSVGDRVQVRCLVDFITKWSLIGFVLKRHINQMLKSDIEKPKKPVFVAEAPGPHKSKSEEILIRRPPTNPPIIPQAEPEGQHNDIIRKSSRSRKQPVRFEDHVLY